MARFYNEVGIDLTNLINEKQKKWDLRFLDAAEWFGTRWSKDPSTKVGAVIADQKFRIVSIGYNGLPQGIPDDPEILNNREMKLKYTVHGEMNAMHFAERSIQGCTLYTWPLSPCTECAKHIIQRGIKRVVAPIMPEDNVPNWLDNMNDAAKLLDVAGISVVLVDQSA